MLITGVWGSLFYAVYVTRSLLLKKVAVRSFVLTLIVGCLIFGINILGTYQANSQ